MPVQPESPTLSVLLLTGGTNRTPLSYLPSMFRAMRSLLFSHLRRMSILTRPPSFRCSVSTSGNSHLQQRRLRECRRADSHGTRSSCISPKWGRLWKSDQAAQAHCVSPHRRRSLECLHWRLVAGSRRHVADGQLFDLVAPEQPLKDAVSRLKAMWRSMPLSFALVCAFISGFQFGEFASR